MIKYYFLLFFRNILRQKLFSSINLLGLTAGIVSTLLIYLYIQHEMSYDRFHEHADHIYRINQTFIWGEHDDNQFASLGPGVATALKAELPEAKEVTRIYPPGNFLITYGENKDNIRSFEENKILAGDSNFFKVFTFPLLSGNPETALRHARTVVLTESTAIKYFGTMDVLGKTLVFEQKGRKEAYEVTGIVNDTPDNSYIEFDFLVSLMSVPGVEQSNDLWLWTMFETFVLVHDNTNIENLKANVLTIPRRYAESTLKKVMYQTFDEFEKNGKKWELFVQPFTSIHLYSSDVYNRINTVGNIITIQILIGVKIFIILLSCINFMNLSTAQYTRRIKESGIRKVMGLDKLQLSFHFFAEAFLYCLLSALIAIGLVQILIPVFSAISYTRLSFDLVSNPEMILLIVGLILLMSIIAGSYPAFFLSKFSAVEAMKGKMRTGKGGKNLRNSLVVVQFMISMIMIVFTIVVFQQIRYLGQKDIGFNRENLIVVSNAEWLPDAESYVNELMNIPGVASVSYNTSVPPHLWDGDQFKTPGSEKVVPLNYAKADEHYVTTLGLKILIGRNFSKDTPADSGRMIINENAVHAFGWTMDESVIGKKIDYPGRSQFEVIGVIRDFNYWGLESPIQPMAIFHEGAKQVFSAGQKSIVIRTLDPQHADLRSIIAATENNWKKFAGTHPFHYSFVDDNFAAYYLSEKKFGGALSVFAGLAIVIASLGLLGMIVYTLEQRTKEIGIRKVVGASVWNIWVLVVKDYTILIVSAIVLSTPICFWFLNQWLQGFEYRVRISPWVFVLSGACMLITSLLITGYHVVKAALKNPVAVLKDE
jgi:putative ABC transport system permease protein